MQRDDGSLWLAGQSDHPLSLADFHLKQGRSNDCGPHVVTMAINFRQGAAIRDAAETARAMNRLRLSASFPPLTIRRIPNWASFPWGIADMLQAHGVTARWRFRAYEAELQAALRDDRLVMPIFGEPFRWKGWRFSPWSHVAIVTGWDPAREVYWFVDSAQTFAPTMRPRDKFLRLWGNMGRLIVVEEDKPAD